ncbi:MAG: zf-TFIIB domain-containing protein [Planctomycetes bacterium]|nr:zf-TFIIB domain-containing protein [Planctomycetota bacterium]
MVNLQLGGVVVDRCGACGGIWLDALEAEKLRETGAGAQLDGERNAPDVAPDAIDCPRCQIRMIVLQVEGSAGFYFEHCGKCNGVFLDSGEMKAMTHATLDQWLRATIPGVYRLKLK